jgi:hypothetical protein
MQLTSGGEGFVVTKARTEKEALLWLSLRVGRYLNNAPSDGFFLQSKLEFFMQDNSWVSTKCGQQPRVGHARCPRSEKIVLHSHLRFAFGCQQ